MARKDLSLYHYTTIPGFIGIVQSKTFHATNSFYLNDEKEIRHSFDLTEDIMQKKIKQNYKCAINTDTDNLIGLLDLLKSMKKAISVIDNYVFSLSESGDILSQWRGYSKNGGVSFSISKSNLEKIVSKNNLKLVKCVYNKSLQTREINKMIDNSVKKFRYSNALNKQSTEMNFFEFVTNLLSISTTYKDPSFREEKEWRIICGSKFAKDTGIFHRDGKNSIIPYTKIDFDDINVIFDKIILGPTTSTDLSVAATKSLLKQNNIKFSSIDKSKIPYRDW